MLTDHSLLEAGLADATSRSTLCSFVRTNTGVRMICPGCLTNKYVKMSGNGFSYTKYIRLVHCMGFHACPIGVTYACYNPACPDVLAKCDKNNITIKSGGLVPESCAAVFDLWNDKLISVLPREVAVKYPLTLFSKGGVGDDVLSMLVQTADTLTSVAHSVKLQFEDRLSKRMEAYYTFVAAERLKAEGRSFSSPRPVDPFSAFGAPLQQLDFPQWVWAKAGSLLGPPSIDSVKSFLLQLYDDLESLLDADVADRVPGMFLSYDHTFEAALKTREGGAMVFLMGEYNDIVSYARVPSTHMKHLMSLFTALSLRLQKMNVRYENVLVRADRAVQFVYSDTCCRKATDVSKSELQAIFENVRGADLADGFHGVQRVPFNQAHSSAAHFMARLGRILRRPHEDDVDEVVKYLMDPERRRHSHLEVFKSQEGARLKALSNSYREHIRKVRRTAPLLTAPRALLPRRRELT